MLDAIVIGCGSRSLMHVSSFRALGCRTLSVVKAGEEHGDEHVFEVAFPEAGENHEYEDAVGRVQKELVAAIAALGPARQYVVVLSTSDRISVTSALVACEAAMVAGRILAREAGGEVDWGQYGIIALLPTAALPQTPDEAKLSSIAISKLTEMVQRRHFDPLIVSDEDNFLSIVSSLIPEEPEPEEPEKTEQPETRDPERSSVFSKLYGE